MTSGKGVDDLINTLTKKKFNKKGLFNYGQDIVVAFSPPVVCCLVKKGLRKGGYGHARTPPWLRLWRGPLYLKEFLPTSDFQVWVRKSNV